MAQIVGCARESTTKKEQDQPLEYQVERLRRYGCDRIYSDRETGRSDYRKRHDEIIAGINSGEISEVVATTISRLGRSVIAIQRIITAITDMNRQGCPVKLTLLDSNVDLQTAMGRAFLMQQVVFAQMESELIGERAAIGWENLRRLGKANRPVWGYRIENGLYVPDRAAWSIARSMIETFISEKALRKVIRYLFDAHPELFSGRLYPGCPRCPVSPPGLRSWLTSETIRGHLVFRNPYLIFSDQHEALISQDEYEVIGEILKHNKAHHGWKTNRDRNPLSGLVRCSACDRACSLGVSDAMLKNGTIKTYRYYRCADPTCPERLRVSAEMIEASIVSALLARANAIADEAFNSETMPRKSQQEIDLEVQIGRLEEIPGENVAIGEAIQKLKTELSIVRAVTVPNKAKSDRHEKILEAVKDPEFWEDLTPENKPLIYRSLVSRVLILGGAICSIDFV